MAQAEPIRYDEADVNEVMAENLRLKAEVKRLGSKLDFIQQQIKTVVEFGNGTLIAPEDKLRRFYFWPEERVNRQG